MAQELQWVSSSPAKLSLEHGGHGVEVLRGRVRGGRPGRRRLRGVAAPRRGASGPPRPPGAIGRDRGECFTSASFLPGLSNKTVTVKPGPVTMLSNRPFIVPGFQGRSRDDFARPIPTLKSFILTIYLIVPQ